MCGFNIVMKLRYYNLINNMHGLTLQFEGMEKNTLKYVINVMIYHKNYC